MYRFKDCGCGSKQKKTVACVRASLCIYTFNTIYIKNDFKSLKSSLGVEAWEEAKKVSCSHANEEALRAVIKHCSDKVCAILEKERPCSALAAQASRCAPVAAQARVAAGSGDVVLDDLALQLQRVGVSKDPAVLAEMSAKLQSDGVSALQDLKGLSQEDVNKQLAPLNLKPVPLNKLLKHISEL